MNNQWENAKYFSNLMMERRGYKLLNNQNTNKNMVLYNNNIENVIIWFFDNDKLNIDYIKEFISILENQNIKHGIVIYQNYITSSTKKVLDNLYKFTIELFLVKEFQYDITQFKYYCLHEKINSSEAKLIKEKFKNNLPFILKNDAISRYFLFHKNDIIKIVRQNNSIIYRIVK